MQPKLTTKTFFTSNEISTWTGFVKPTFVAQDNTRARKKNCMTDEKHQVFFCRRKKNELICVQRWKVEQKIGFHCDFSRTIPQLVKSQGLLKQLNLSTENSILAHDPHTLQFGIEQKSLASTFQLNVTRPKIATNWILSFKAGLCSMQKTR